MAEALRLTRAPSSMQAAWVQEALKHLLRGIGEAAEWICPLRESPAAELPPDCFKYPPY